MCETIFRSCIFMEKRCENGDYLYPKVENNDGTLKIQFLDVDAATKVWLRKFFIIGN